MMSPIITNAIKAMLPTAMAPLAPDTYDPVLILEHEHRAARKAWGRAQEAAEEIECGLPDNIRRPGVLILYATKEDECRLFGRDEAAQAKAAGAEPVYVRNIQEMRKFGESALCGGVFETDAKAKPAYKAKLDQFFCREIRESLGHP